MRTQAVQKRRVDITQVGTITPVIITTIISIMTITMMIWRGNSDISCRSSPYIIFITASVLFKHSHLSHSLRYTQTHIHTHTHSLTSTLFHTHSHPPTHSLQWLCGTNASLNTKLIATGVTPLYLAARSGFHEIVEILVRVQGCFYPTFCSCYCVCIFIVYFYF